MNIDIQNCVKILKNDGTMLYPTDTIWGLGCDVASQKAIQKVLGIKRIAHARSMIALVDSAERLADCVEYIPPVVYDLLEAADKPLTIVYPKAKGALKNIAAEDGSVGIRITNEKFSHELCKMFRKPVVSTSANISGLPSPALFSEIAEAVKNGVDYIIQYRQDETAKARPSGIIKLSEDGCIKIIRE
jgi:L-threonylcarbamoyladenylate synthase